MPTERAKLTLKGKMMNPGYTIFYKRNHILETLMKTLRTFLDSTSQFTPDIQPLLKLCLSYDNKEQVQTSSQINLKFFRFQSRLFKNYK